MLRLEDDASTEAALARSADDPGVVVLPFFAGERAPGWRGDRQAVLAGLTLDTTALSIVRAVLEAIALRLRLVYGLLAPRAAADHVLVGSGGALVASPAWSQIIADTLDRPLIVSPEEEATSRGAALLALDALGLRRFTTATPTPHGRTFVPDPVAHARASAALARQEALDRALGP